MSSKSPLTVQRRSRRSAQLPTCEWCDNPIRFSPRRPRRFCGDKCRQAAHRQQFRDSAETTRPTTHGQFRDSLSPADPSTIEAPIRHLLGSGAKWKGGVELDRKLVGKIVRSEIGGDPVEVITSSDGVQSFVLKSGKTASNNFTNTPRPRPVAAAGTGNAINVAASNPAEMKG